MRRACSPGLNTLTPVRAGLLPSTRASPAHLTAIRSHTGRLLGDYGVGLPVRQALATLGVVMVADADHIASLKKPRRHMLAGHDPPGQDCGHSTYNYKAPRCESRFTDPVSWVNDQET
jgi:hypothetical protein